MNVFKYYLIIRKSVFRRNSKLYNMINNTIVFKVILHYTVTSEYSLGHWDIPLGSIKKFWKRLLPYFMFTNFLQFTVSLATTSPFKRENVVVVLIMIRLSLLLLLLLVLLHNIIYIINTIIITINNNNNNFKVETIDFLHN